MNPSELDELILQARDGDNAAFDAVVRALGPDLHMFVAFRCHKQEVIDEVVQRTFVTAWEKLETYKPQGFLLAWLKGIAKNVILQQYRENSRVHTHEADELEALICGKFIDLNDADEEDTEQEMLPQLLQCLEKLDERSRAMLEKHHAERIPLAKLAQQYKKKVGALSALLQRIRKKVRGCMEAHA